MPSIPFLSKACPFDRRSGAAHSVRVMLHALAAAGWQARAVTLSLCDGAAEYPFAATHAALDPAVHAGHAVTVTDATGWSRF